MSGARSYSLLELVGSVRKCLESGFTGTYWVRAETSDLRQSGGAGHCYMELLEKGTSGNVVARTRAMIWSATYAQIRQSLASSGAGALTSGMNILVRVSVSFHEQYGLSLVIHEIDPAYSLGELARLRLETIERLKRNGILEMNKQVPLPRLPQRLAIISAAGAAGYGDFLRHLEDNRYGLQFYKALFVAQMQGERTADSVVSALNRLLVHQDLFDAVVIIRGGGAVSELRAFDSYELCEYCAQYPLPILSGIGHERDQSVLDLVAHQSFKTPTAVADYLVQTLYAELRGVEQGVERLRSAVRELSAHRENRLELVLARLPRLAAYRLEVEQGRQRHLQTKLSHALSQFTAREARRIDTFTERLPYILRGALEQHRMRLDRLMLPLPMLVRGHEARLTARLEQLEQAVRLSHPEQIMRRGFAVIETNSGIITNAEGLTPGACIGIRLSGRRIKAKVERVD